MAFALFVLITALSISAVAVYYSIIGLMAIFAAAAIPIAIMGVTLEVGKLVTASWLYQYWEKIPKFLKYYLTLAVVVLMFITSMGIFGFLSKAHVEQTSSATQAEARVERVDEKITRFKARVNSIKEKVVRLQSADVGQQNTTITRAIEQQTTRRDTAWDRVSSSIQQEQTQIDALQSQLEKDIVIQEQRVANAQQRVRDDIAVKQKAIERVNLQIAQLDASVKAYTDKGVEKKTWGQPIDYIRRGKELREKQKPQRDAFAAQIKVIETEINLARQGEIRIATAVQNEITILRESLAENIKPHQDIIEGLRTNAQKEIDNANTQITVLQEQMSTKADDTDVQISQLELQIESYYTNIDTLKEERFILASTVRKLETEVGPVKYIAQLIYGSNVTRDLLEDAVRWVIITIIFVFDPLAVLLVIAGNMTLKRFRDPFEKKKTDPLWSKTGF